MLILHLLVPFPSSPLVIAPFQACWAIPQFTVNACWQLFLFCFPGCSEPFALIPCPCWLLSCGTALPLAPAASHAQFWPALAQCQSPNICGHVQYSQKICLMVPKDLSIGKPGRKKAELGCPSPSLHGFEGMIGVPSWEVTPGRNILQFLMGMKTNCNLQLNSGFCFQASHVCYAGLQLLF